MAVARAQGSNDGRVACPHCGGLVHPIAGRCKHCKADLAALRSPAPVGKAASQPAMPAMPTMPVMPPLAATRAEPAPVAAPQVSPWAPPGAEAPPLPAYSVPQLPPAPPPVARYQPNAGPYASASRDAFAAPPLHVIRELEPEAPRGPRLSWPVVVIIIAGVTIAAAVAIMLWPDHKKAPPKLDLLPPPAPERMNTDPLPEHGEAPPPTHTDPWANGGSAAKKPIDPDIDPPPPRQDPDDTQDDDDTTGTQGSAGAGGLTGPLGGNGLGLTGNGMIALEVFKHACTRLATCSDPDPAITQACKQLTQMSATLPSAGPLCDAAKRCLAHIDTLDCSAHVDATQLLGLLNKFDDCAEAMKGC